MAKPLSKERREYLLMVARFSFAGDKAATVSDVLGWEATVQALELRVVELENALLVATADADGQQGTLCSVCGMPCWWGSRHSTCGAAVQALEAERDGLSKASAIYEADSIKYSLRAVALEAENKRLREALAKLPGQPVSKEGSDGGRGER